MFVIIRSSKLAKFGNCVFQDLQIYGSRFSKVGNFEALKFWKSEILKRWSFGILKSLKLWSLETFDGGWYLCKYEQSTWLDNMWISVDCLWIAKDINNCVWEGGRRGRHIMRPKPPRPPTKRMLGTALKSIFHLLTFFDQFRQPWRFCKCSFLK